MNNNGIVLVKPVIDYTVRKLCLTPYYNHKHGCPNYNKKKGCPPGAPLFDHHYDMTQSIYAIYNVFDFGHVAKMKVKHPEWTKPKLKCVLYWQGTASQEAA